MFTDTKNRGNANVILDMSVSSSSCQSKSRVHKALKPLLRLLSKSSAKSTSVKAISHPNNVNLNNNTCPKETSEDVSTAMLADYVAVQRKVTKDAQPKPSEDPSTNDELVTTVISSASYEKSPMTICTGCSHGRNCQHAEYHHPSWCSPIAGDVSEGHEGYRWGPESSTFFWPNPHQQVDDDLLSVWLCQNFRQYPPEAVAY